MRFYFYCYIIIVLLSCNVTKEQGKDQKASLPPPHINCPEGGDCSLEVFENSVLSLNYTTDGELYPKVTEGENIVVKFHYKKDPVKNVMDSSYSEYIYLEFNPEESQLVLKDKELQKVKMIFGRICYCKGAMGYFPVREGNLFLFNKGGNLQIRSSFKIHKVPQIVQQIDENINY